MSDQCDVWKVISDRMDTEREFCGEECPYSKDGFCLVSPEDKDELEEDYLTDENGQCIMSYCNMGCCADLIERYKRTDFCMTQFGGDV